MSVKIRLQRHGRKKKPFYHIVIADARSPRDGRFIEKIGVYNPMTVPATIDLDRDKAYDWMEKGAQPTDTVRAMLKFKGVMYRRHLMRGVAKGSFNEEKAMEMYQAWIDKKEEKVAVRRAEAIQKKKDWLKAVADGTIAPSVNKKADSELAAPDAPAADAPAPEAKADAPAPEVKKEEPKKEEAPKAEVKKEEPKKEEAPKAEVKKEEPKKEEAPKAEVKKEEPKKEEAPKAEVKKEEPKKEEVVKAAADLKTTESVTTSERIIGGVDGFDANAVDLTKIEGIGPKMDAALKAGGISSYTVLSFSTPEKIKGILDAAEGNFGMADPTTWPAQAKMAAAGEWDKLKKWQDELDGGKEK